ncbi:helix-turn-helix domain-containing protein [Chryseobacterium sp. DT-3]|uniref:helix-turn-helix domain-containing protein n=1 Tax=Chryseobacterium sp. DT-3 TaxID=3396164 RepID=UPI003F1C4BCA
MIPNYKLIFTDILDQKYPQKKEYCKNILNKTEINELDVINLNQIIFGNKSKVSTINQKFKAYNKSTIVEILRYQTQNHLNNTQIANHFNLSRNTVSKWRKQFETH